MRLLSIQVQVCPDGEFAHCLRLGLPKPNHRIGRAANRLPFNVATHAQSAAHGFRQGVAATNSVQKTEGVPDVALATGVGAHDHGERTEPQGLVGEVLEIHQL